jgi:hypothetical protein
MEVSKVRSCKIFIVTKLTESVLRIRSTRHAPKLLLCVALAFSLVTPFLATLPGVCAGEIDWSLNPDMGKKPARSELSPLESGSANELWAGVLASSYQVTVDFVNSLYERRLDFGEIALMMDMARASKKDPSDIAFLRRKGLGWGAIAKQVGVRPAEMERAKGKDSLFERYVLARCLAGYYGIPDSEVLVLLSEKGYGFDEIAIAVNVCAHSGTPLRDVIAARASGARWKMVAGKFKMSPAQLGKPPAEYLGGKAKNKRSGKPTGGASGNKARSADCSKTCPRKCY